MHKKFRPCLVKIILTTLCAIICGSHVSLLYAASKLLTTKQLLRKIEQRDVLIRDLQRRVEELERSSGQAMQQRDLSTEKQQSSSSAAASTTSVLPPTTNTKPPVTEEGKAHSAPGQFEVDENAAQRALERTLVQTGALLLPYGQAEIQPSFTYARSDRSIPSFLDELGNRRFPATQRLRRDTFIGDIFLRIGLPLDAQLELGIPYRYTIQDDKTADVLNNISVKNNADGSGIGDFRLGLAKTLLREDGWWPDVIGRITWDSNSGTYSDNGILLGYGYNDLTGSVTMIKRQDPLVFIGGISYQANFMQHGVGNGNALGFTTGAILAASPETSIRIIFNQSFVNELKVNNRVIDGSDQTIGTLTFGGSSIIGHGMFLDLAVGIGLTNDASDYTVALTFSKRFDLPVKLLHLQ